MYFETRQNMKMKHMKGLGRPITGVRGASCVMRRCTDCFLMVTWEHVALAVARADLGWGSRQEVYTLHQMCPCQKSQSALYPLREVVNWAIISSQKDNNIGNRF